MSQYTKLAAEAADKYLGALEESQTQLLKTVSTFSSWTPAAPAMPTPPFAEELPTPKEIAEANFAFAAKLLKQQKAFAEKFFAASTSAS